MVNPDFTTRTQLKELLGITDTAYDTFIDVYIPQVNSFLFNSFDGWLNDEYLYTTDATIENDDEFVVLDLERISRKNTFVVNGQDQSKLYIVNIIDIDDKKLFTDFNVLSLLTATIRLRTFPMGGKLIACQMVLWLSIKALGSGYGQDQLESERIGNYNYKLADAAVIKKGYPMEYIDGLEQYKKYCYGIDEVEVVV